LQDGEAGFSKRIKSASKPYQANNNEVKTMGNTAVVECLDFQSGVFPTAFLCAPSFADAKPLDSAENMAILDYKQALIPNSLNAGFYNIGKTSFKDSQVGKLLKMSRQIDKIQKTIWLPKSSVSLSSKRLRYRRRDP